MLQCGHEMFLLINEIRFETTKLYQKRRNSKKIVFVVVSLHTVFQSWKRESPFTECILSIFKFNDKHLDFGDMVKKPAYF